MKSINRRAKSELISRTIFSVLFMLLALTYLYSLGWAILAGGNTHDAVVLYPFKWPEKFNIMNYIDAFTMLEVRDTNMIMMIFNSVWLATGTAVLNIFAAALMAYAVTKYKFIGRKFLVVANIIIMTLPIIGSMPSTYRIYSTLNFIDSPLILICSFSGFGAINLYMCAFFKNLSWTFAESAIMDGAGNHRILFQIMLPLARGPIFALGIIQFVAMWNDYTTALVFLPNLPTLATGIYLFQVQMQYAARMDILMAATVLSTLPPLVLYMCFNKLILSNVTLGGVKE